MNRRLIHISAAIGSLIIVAVALIPHFGSVEARPSFEQRTKISTNPVSEQLSNPRLRSVPVYQFISTDTLFNFTDRRRSIPIKNTEESSEESVQNTQTPSDPSRDEKSDVVQTEPKVLLIEDSETETIAPDQNKEKAEKHDDSNTVLEHAFLTLHNEVRNEHELPPFMWSDELASGAQNWADTLADEACEMRHSDESLGENLFIMWSSDASLQSTPEDAMNWWVDGEEEHYSYETNTCAEGEVCGHFTQIIWKATTHVGCGMSRCSEPSKTTDLYVCRYSPQGNIIGQQPY